VVTDKDVLQREAKTDVAGWMWAGATGLIGFMYLAFITAIAVGVGRVGGAAAGPPSGASASPTKASQPHTPAGEAEEVGVGSSDGEAVGRPRFA
jgi:hypothetical protein